METIGFNVTCNMTYTIPSRELYCITKAFNLGDRYPFIVNAKNPIFHKEESTFLSENRVFVRGKVSWTLNTKSARDNGTSPEEFKYLKPTKNYQIPKKLVHKRDPMGQRSSKLIYGCNSTGRNTFKTLFLIHNHRPGA